MKRLIGLFDMDDSLVDYTGGVIKSLNEIRHPSEPEYKERVPWERHNGKRIDMLRQVPGWWLNLKRLKRGFDIYNLAKEMGFMPHIATVGPLKSPNAWTEKYLWGQRETPEAPMTITRNKSLLYGRFLVDDYVPYIKEWLKNRPRGVGIMPAHPHNEGFTHPQVIRYDETNLDEVKEMLTWAKNRK